MLNPAIDFFKRSVTRYPNKYCAVGTLFATMLFHAVSFYILDFSQTNPDPDILDILVSMAQVFALGTGIATSVLFWLAPPTARGADLREWVTSALPVLMRILLKPALILGALTVILLIMAGSYEGFAPAFAALLLFVSDAFVRCAIIVIPLVAFGAGFLYWRSKRQMAQAIEESDLDPEMWVRKGVNHAIALEPGIKGSLHWITVSWWSGAWCETLDPRLFNEADVMRLVLRKTVRIDTRYSVTQISRSYPIGELVHCYEERVPEELESPYVAAAWQFILRARYAKAVHLAALCLHRLADKEFAIDFGNDGAITVIADKKSVSPNLHETFGVPAIRKDYARFEAIQGGEAAFNRDIQEAMANNTDMEREAPRLVEMDIAMKLWP
ncbi:MAG TPA: hypothetical protein DD390_16900 [Rhodospirillaceae bacterium]|nr:hypothetical protein [Rhodospirillaceae bacterium]MAX61926.1 hypothetical protein [Rhodospirillaceae bacterium]MAX63262.1 hypothetical protein [Rhodospirillaceae bacterium]HBM14375.1 hypothetical protein [Rhodospirillaceae bacterium]|tara:strand:- start:341 stop:1492 length:1152 start_codon:yes stop_codon:yes gene_type:complete